MTPAATDDPVLRCVEVTQEFRVTRRGSLRRQSVSAVAGVSLEVARGETVAIVGETGSGKSTLARSIIGAPPPRSGRIQIGGRDVFDGPRRSTSAIGRLVQMVFQEPLSALDPQWTVGRLVSEPLTLDGGLDRTRRRRMAAEMLGLVGLNASQFADRRAGQLSGGEAQRVAIARALVSSPELLVCDEPVTALDVSVQAQILKLLFDLRADLGLTYLIIAHDLAVVRVLADRVATMYLGKLCEIGPTERIFGQVAHPYTAALLSAIPPPVGTPEAQREADGQQRIRLLGEPPSPTDPPSGCRFRTRCARAQDLCAQREPQMRELAPGHQVACHFPLIPAGAAPS
jgi:oligopeptide/dipeptide ABC transporter ATP-binding protein